MNFFIFASTYNLSKQHPLKTPYNHSQIINEQNRNIRQIK